MPILFLIIFLGSCSRGPENAIEVYPQLGHSHIVNTAFYSEDGRYIVSSSWDMSVKLWDVASMREAATFSGHTDRVNYAVTSRDNRLIASASRDGTVRIWDTKTGKEILRLEEEANTVEFGADDKTIITTRGDELKEWNAKTGKLVRAFSKERAKNIQPSSAMAFNRDRKYMALGAWDGGVSLLESETGKSVRFPAHAKEVTALTFSNDNRYLATASRDRSIILWNMIHSENSDMLEIHPAKSFSCYTGDVNSVSFSPDNRFIAAALSDKTIKILDTASGEETTLGGYSCSPVLSVISHDNQYIASMDRAGILKIWNAKTGVFIESIDSVGEISSMVFASDNESLIAVLPDGTVEKNNIKTGTKQQLSVKNQGTSARIHSLDSAGNRIVSVLWDGTIEIWDYANGETKIFERSEDALILAAGLDAEGRLLATGFINGKLRITDLKNEKDLLSVQYKSPVDSVGFSADGLLLACGLRDGSIQLLDMSTGKEIKHPIRHLFGVSSVSFNADGSRIISAVADNATVLWNVKTGEKIASFISFNDDEWIAITGDGYYDASPRGDERLNVRIGGELYGMDQFSAVFFQADVVNARLEGRPEPAPVTQNDMRALVPPAIFIKAPQESNAGKEVIDVSIKDLFRPLHAIQIVINGRLLGADELTLIKTNANISVERASIVVNSSINELTFTIPVNLEAGSNRIQIIATNRGGQSTVGAEGRKSVYIVNVSETNAPAPDLWVLAIGSNSPISGRNESSLKYAVNNAKSITALFESQQGKRYRNVHTRLIVDGEAIAMSREQILDSIKNFFGNANSKDVLVLFISGHGEYRENSNNYCFLPQAITLDDIGILAEMPGRKIIFIDSCFSGGVDDKRLAGKLKNQSTAIITSSQKDERSWEGSAAVPYGFFTNALITGIGGDAAANNEVKLYNLGDYVYNKVKLLTGGMQNPYVYVPEGFGGFVLSMNFLRNY